MRSGRLARVLIRSLFPTRSECSWGEVFKFCCWRLQCRRLLGRMIGFGQNHLSMLRLAKSSFRRASRRGG